MPKICSNCSSSGGILKDASFILYNGKDLCAKCANDLIVKIDELILITGSDNLEGYRIISYLGIESAEVIMAIGMFAEFVGDTHDYFENRSSLFEKNLKKARNLLIKRLKLKAYNCSGNAIIRFNFNYTGISAHRVVVVAAGTIVTIEKQS